MSAGEEGSLSLHKALSVELWFFYLFSTMPRPFQNTSNKDLGHTLFRMFAIGNNPYNVKEWHCSF